MPFVSRRADLLERSTQGLPCTDQEVRSLVAIVSRIPVLTSVGCAPRDEFVSALGLQLRAEALKLPDRSAARARSRPPSTASATRARRPTTKPVVFVIGRGMRVVAGATASLLLIGAVLGLTARSALPGGLLYPVKQLLSSASVQLAGSELDRGMTLLSQAQADISDARALVERDRGLADPDSVDQALLSAYDSAKTGQRALLGEFDRTGNTHALIAVQDFAVRAMPQLNALRRQVPTASRADVDALIALLQNTRSTVERKLAVCGQPCASLGGVRFGSSPVQTPSTGPPSSLPVGGLRLPGLPTGRVPVVGQGPAITGPGGVVLGRSGSQLPIAGNRTPGASDPPATLGPITLAPPPVMIPPPPHLPQPAPALPPPPSGLPSLH